MSSSENSQVVRFDDRRIPTPVNASPATCIPLNLAEALDLWSHAVLLFHSYEWEQAVTAHRRLIKRCENTVPLARLWFNVGVIRSHLGEYFLASEAFTKAVKIRKTLAIGWYCLGMAIFQLGDFRKAKRPFQRCLSLFDEGVTTIDYRSLGLDFILEKTRVEWNERQTFFEKAHKQMRAPMPLDTHLSLNRLPAGKIFAPTSQWAAGTGFEDGGEVALSSSISSSLTSSTLDSGSPSSPSPGKRTRNLLRKRSHRRLALGHSASRSLDQSTPPNIPNVALPASSSFESKISQPRFDQTRPTVSSSDQYKPLPPLPFVSPEALRTLHKRMNVSPSPRQGRKALPALLFPSTGKSTVTYSMETASRSSVSLEENQTASTQSLALRSVENLLEPTAARPTINSRSSSSSNVAGATSQPINLSRDKPAYSNRALPHETDQSYSKIVKINRGRDHARSHRQDRFEAIPQYHSEVLPEPAASSNFASQRYGTLELEDNLTPAPLFSSPSSRSGSKDRTPLPMPSLQTLPATRYNPRSSSLPRKPITSASPLQTLISARYDPNAPTQSGASDLPTLAPLRYQPFEPTKSTTPQQQTLKPAQYNTTAPTSPSPELPLLSSTHYNVPIPKTSPPPHLPTITSARYDPNAAPSQQPIPNPPQEEEEETNPQRIDSYAIFSLGKEAAQAALRERDENRRLQSGSETNLDKGKGRKKRG
ncbi:MAG: hypothetical protein M1812_002732 [Candelaria pacifica]|nr:MAG: hypothetical protein M1812_002732 [Candelaria pacifica]